MAPHWTLVGLLTTPPTSLFLCTYKNDPWYFAKQFLLMWASARAFTPVQGRSNDSTCSEQHSSKTAPPTRVSIEQGLPVFRTCISLSRCTSQKTTALGLCLTQLVDKKRILECLQDWLALITSERVLPSINCRICKYAWKNSGCAIDLTKETQRLTSVYALQACAPTLGSASCPAWKHRTVRRSTGAT